VASVINTGLLFDQKKLGLLIAPFFLLVGTQLDTCRLRTHSCWVYWHCCTSQTYTCSIFS